MKLSENLLLGIPRWLKQKWQTNKQTKRQTNQQMFFISAKSGPTFMKLSENIPVDIPRRLKQKIANRQTDKSINKQTNIYWSTISHPNQVQYLWYFRKSYFGIPFKQKTTKQLILWIDNISAKSCQIFKNFM